MFPRLMLIIALALMAQSAKAQDVYSVGGDVKGFFCRYFGFVCEFKKVDALKSGKGEIRALPRSFDNVSDYKPSNDGTAARCWVTTKADESSLGWWAYIVDWWKDAPIFFATKKDGTYEALGSPDFIVFPCRKY